MVAPPTIDDRPRLPERTDHGIAIIGCGGIVNYAHLPAYLKHDLNVVGCFDANRAAAERTAAAFAIPRVYDDLGAVLVDPTVEIVDVAVTPEAQCEIAARALAAGMHVLCQKPLGLTIESAQEIVDAAIAGGGKAAVNQQMRWSGGIAAAKQVIDSGYLGHLTDLQINVSVLTPWHMWPWLQRSDQLDVMYHSIHYLDAVRFLAGNPISVTSRHSRFPGQAEVAETKTITILDYADGCQALVAVNHHDHSGAPAATFRILGTEGVLEGTIGLLATYPDGGVDTVRFRRGDDPPGAWQVPELTTLWIPDAFIGPMASLMEAIATCGEPVTGVADNVETVRLVAAAYASMAEGRTVELGSFARGASTDSPGAEAPGRIEPCRETYKGADMASDASPTSDCKTPMSI